MEVASIFSSEKKLVNIFYEFVKSYDKLSLSLIDDDTAYFENSADGKNEMFLHYKLNDIENGFGSNFSEEQSIYIVNYFRGFSVFLFDISFRNTSFFNTLLTEFIFSLKNKNIITVDKILLNDPFEGLKPIL